MSLTLRMKLLPGDQMLTHMSGALMDSMPPSTTYYQMHRSPEWELLSWNMSKSVDSSDGEYWSVSRVYYKLEVQRKNTLYSLLLLLPTVTLGLLSLTIFLVPLGDSARLDYGLNILLSFFVLLTMIAETLPPAQDNVPKLGIYLCASLILLAASILISALLNKLHEYGARGSHLPRCCDWLFSCKHHIREKILPGVPPSDDIEADQPGSAAERKSRPLRGAKKAKALPLAKSKNREESAERMVERQVSLVSEANTRQWQQVVRWVNRVCLAVFAICHIVGIILVFVV